jgi:hypothetical protein
MRKIAILISAVLMCSLLAVSAMGNQELKADEILARARFGGELKGEGSLITSLRFDIEEVNTEITISNSFVAFSKRTEEGTEFLLFYFLDAGYNTGSILLMKTEQEETRQWYYSPEWELLRELDVQAQEQGLAGSNISFQNLGGYEFEDSYTAELTGDDSITIGEAVRPVYVLSLTAKPETETDFPTATMWVDKEDFFVLRMENANPAGNTVQLVEVLALAEFGGKTTVDQLINKDLLEEKSTTITFLERKQPDEEFPESLFDPENLPSFDPAMYGY